MSSKTDIGIRYLISIAVFPLIILLNLLLPDAANRPDQPKNVLNSLLLFYFGILSIYVLYGHILNKQPTVRVQMVTDISLIFGSFILIWVIFVGKLGFLNTHSFPDPNTVFKVYMTDFDFLTYQSSKASIIRAFLGYFLALATAIPLGIFAGRNLRAFSVSYPFSKVTAHIPPIVYLPYAVAIFPSINHAIIFIIFIGAFWPILINTMFGVYNIDPKIIEFAKILGANDKRILAKVIVPAATPYILAGSLIGLVVSFVLLTAGEMVGANAGLGFYLMYYFDVGYFDKVVAGILLISFWVFFWITFGFDIVQSRLLRWQRKIG
jgi:NitT/TauT family transport system permease protein|tara:strand:- start:927 stop:1892 length:966 start_codon:yes stop_codon:yes gene_type:complete